MDEVSGMHVVPAGCGGKINSARNSQITKHLQGTGVHEDKKKIIEGIDLFNPKWTAIRIDKGHSSS